MAQPRNNAGTDQNWRPTLLAVSSADGTTPVAVEADPLTGALLTSGGGSGGGTVNQSNSIDVQPATQNITAQDIASSTATGANGQSIITGVATTNSTASFPLAGWETVSLQVSGVWTGTLQVEGSFDGGTTWYSKAIKQTGTGYTVNGFSSNFAGAVNTSTLTMLRVRATTAWTGTATVKITESFNQHSVYIANNLHISDGVVQSTVATVKPASTAPVATDTSLVVAMSPNSIATTLNAELPDITGIFTNATQTTAVQATGLNGYDNVFVSISGTYTAATATFQGSDDGGATWKNIAVAARTDSQTIESGYTNLSSIGRGWNINIQGFDAFQVLSSAVATGTVNVRISPESAPTNAGATVGVASRGDGTNNINVLKSDGTAAGQNAELVSGTGMTTGTLTLNSGSPATAWFDMLNYAWVSVEVLTNTTPATLSWQSSGDASQTNITSMGMNLASNISLGGLVTTTSTNGTFHGPRTGRYFRVNSNNGAGTTTLVITFFTNASAFFSSPTAVGSNSATGSAVPANAFYLGLRGATSNLTGLVEQSQIGDASGAAGMAAAGLNLYNSASYDRIRSATAASNTTGTGLLGAGNLIFDGTNWQTMVGHVDNADGIAVTTTANRLLTNAQNYSYNGTSYDRARNNTTGVVIAAGATASNAGVSVTTYNASKALINTNIASGAGTVVVAINGVTASGYVYNILTSSAFTGVGNNQQRIFPGATAATGLVANDLVPRTLQIVTTVVGTISYGIDYELSV